MGGLSGKTAGRLSSRRPAYGRSRRLFNALILGGFLALFSSGFEMTQAFAKPFHLLAFGDSLTAGYGLPPRDGFVPQLQQALKDKGLDVEISNAGVSGDTTAGGLARLAWALGDKPDAAILELGANDMLRGLPPEKAKANLDAMLARFKQAGVPVLLAGMKASPSLGPDYVRAFDALYPDLAQAYGVALYPFFLDGVATDPGLSQGDGIHPNARGVAEIVRRILPGVVRLIENTTRPK